MASSKIPISLQLSRDDQIPFVDADESCDGSVSSEGTGSVLGHSTSEEDLSHTNTDLQHHWKLEMGDHHSLNNMLDTVSSETRLADLDYLSVDNPFLKAVDNLSLESGVFKNKSSPSLSEDVANYEALETLQKPARPTSLKINSDLLEKNRKYPEAMT